MSLACQTYTPVVVIPLERLFSVNRFYPVLVGNDIGCGMTLFQTEFNHSKLNLDKIGKKIEPEMSDIAPIEWLIDNLPADMQNHPFALTH